MTTPLQPFLSERTVPPFYETRIYDDDTPLTEVPVVPKKVEIPKVTDYNPPPELVEKKDVDFPFTPHPTPLSGEYIGHNISSLIEQIKKELNYWVENGTDDSLP